MKKKGRKKDGHTKCKCKYYLWNQMCREPIVMQVHLALNYKHIPYDIKIKYLLSIKLRNKAKANKKKCIESQILGIDNYYKSTIITSAK